MKHEYFIFISLRVRIMAVGMFQWRLLPLFPKLCSFKSTSRVAGLKSGRGKRAAEDASVKLQKDAEGPQVPGGHGRAGVPAGRNPLF